MTPEEYAAARRVFLEASRLEGAARSKFLDESCGSDARLRSIVESWLALDADELDALPVLGTGPVAEPHPGRIGEFEVIELLGEGGMGRVYLARQRTPDRLVAIKMLALTGAASRQAIARFEAEGEFLARLHHDGIAQVYSAGWHETEHGRIPYIVMEWIEGSRSLTTHADEAGLDLEGRLKLFLQLMDAVLHAHQRGVIHRDLKPSNVLVTKAGRCKVLDFGIARQVGPEAATSGDLTQHGQPIGTLSYMSPEQAQGLADIDVRTDVYALGVILFELIAGRLPFSLPADARAAVKMIADARPPRLDSIRPSVSRDLAAVVEVALAKEKQRRFDTVAAFADDVRRILERRPVSARPISSWERGVYFVRRRKATAAAIAFLVLGLLGSGSFGVKAYFAERTAEAKDREKRALEIEAMFRYGEQRAREGDWTKALQQYDEALGAGYPDPTEVRLAQIEALEGIGDVRAAGRVLDELSTQSDVALGEQLARVLLFRADRTKTPATRLAPFRGDALIEHALRLETLSKADTAYANALLSTSAKDQLRYLRDALRADSHHRSANEMIAPTLLAAGHPREALTAATEFRRLYPDDPAAQAIHLRVRTFLEGAIPEDLPADYPAVQDDVVAVLEQAVTALRVVREGVDELIVKDLQRDSLGAPRSSGVERLRIFAGFTPLFFARTSSSGSIEAMFRVPPRLSEVWFEVLKQLPSTLFGGHGSTEALEFFSKAKTTNDDALLAFYAGVHRLLLNRDNPAYWKDFAEAADRESWLDVRKASLVMVVLASNRHPGAVPRDVTSKAIEQLLRDFDSDRLGFNFLWHASRANGLDSLGGEVFHRWSGAFPDDPALAEAKAWDRTH